MQKSVYKSFFLILFALFSAMLFMLLPQFSFAKNTVYAQNNSSIKPNVFFEPQGYMDLQEVSSVYINSKGYYLSHSNGISFVDGQSLQTVSLVSFGKNAQKIAFENNIYFYLFSGQLFTFFNNTEVLLGSYTDFSISDGTLYAVENNLVDAFSLTDLTTLPKRIITLPSVATKIAATKGNLFVSVKSSSSTKLNDILVYNIDHELYNYLSKVPEVDAITDMCANENNLYSLDRTGTLNAFSFNGNLSIPTPLQNSDTVALSCFNDALFAINGQGNLLKYNKDTALFYAVLACASNEYGFFNAPVSLASKKGMIVIADSRNNRIAVFKEGKYHYIQNIFRPQAVAVDAFAQIVAFGNTNQLIWYNSNFLVEKTIELATTIIDIKFDSNNTMFALSEQGILYKAAAFSNTLVALNELSSPIQAFDISPAKDTVYILQERAIASLDGTETLCTLPEDALDFMIDHDNSAYVLSKDATLTKYVNSAQSESLLPLTIREDAACITMNTVISSESAYGDLLFVSKKANALFSYSAGALKINEHFDFTASVPLPDTSTPPLIENGSHSILFTLNYNAEVYAQQAEVNPLYTLQKDTTVIIPIFDVTKKFTLIIADNITGKTPICGYVYTSFISSSPLPYTTDHPEKCTTFLANVPIYAFPTLNSPVYTALESLPKGTQLTLLDFAFTEDSQGNVVYGYTDNLSKPTVWYRVAFGENYFGYVTSDFISLRGENPDTNVYPRTNAKIVSLDKNNKNLGALVYAKDESGNFTVREDLPPIAVNTRVEVVGAFDSSKPYTLVRFTSAHGTMEAWVNTKNIVYDGINMVQIAALLIILFTLILITFVIIRIVKTHNKRKFEPIEKI